MNLDNIHDFLEEDDFQTQESYPSYYYEWDKALSQGKAFPFCEMEELLDIIGIYVDLNKKEKLNKTISYALETYLNLSEGDDEILYEIATLLEEEKRWDELLRIMNQYKDEKIFWVDSYRVSSLLNLGMEEEAFQLFSLLKKTYAKDTPSLKSLYFEFGNSLLETSLYQAVILVINEAIDQLGEDEEFYWIQFDAYLALENKKEVSRLAEKIINTSPFDGFCWFRIGTAYKELQDFESAINAFEHALNLNYEDKKKNLLELSESYELNGNQIKALETIKEFLYLYPDSYFFNLSAANLCANMNEWQEAIKFIDNVLKVQPGMSALYLYKSTYYINMGEYKKAKITLEEGIANTNNSDHSDKELENQLNLLNEQYPDV